MNAAQLTLPSDPYKFRHINVWDHGVRVMMIEYRVVEFCRWTYKWWYDHGIGRTIDVNRLRFDLPYMLEIIVHGTCGLGLHQVDDYIDGPSDLRPNPQYGNRSLLCRYVYDSTGDGLGDDFEISNSRCMITIRVNRDAQHRLVSDVVGELIIVPGTDNSRSFRKPQLAVAA